MEENNKSERPLSLQILNNPYDMGEHGARPLTTAITSLLGLFQEKTDFGKILIALRNARENVCMNYVAKCLDSGMTHEEVSDEFFNLNSKAGEDAGVDVQGEIFTSVFENCKKAGFGETMRYLLSLQDFCFIQGATLYFSENPSEIHRTVDVVGNVHGI